ncbi:MAG: hypothetical protein HY526_13800 [Betaproteobacteria bacterium]|nr:hypothetical protein [Betaproteobacteria bacterium]
MFHASGEHTTKNCRKALVVSLLFATVSPFAGAPTAFAQSSVTLTHVHGLAYSADGKRLMVPSYYGLAVYSEGRWTKAPGPRHDYMGFSATRTRFYSSGHPAPGSGFNNPFGLIRSQDGGKKWDRFGLEGVSDFHALAAGWNSNAIYVWSSLQRDAVAHIARNPVDRREYAIATFERSIYVSMDAGRTWKQIANRGRGL